MNFKLTSFVRSHWIFPSRTAVGRALSAGALALSLLPAFARATPTVFVEPATQKVRPAAVPNGERTAKLTAARNEFEAFQIVVKSDGAAVEGVSAEASELLGPAGARIPAENLTLFREDLLNITTASGSIGRTGAWPDALVPDRDELDGQARSAFPFTVGAGQARAIWVDVLVPADAPPGRYHGEVRISGAQGLSETVPVEVEVWDFGLPSTPTLGTAFLLFAPGVCRAHLGSDCSAPGAAELIGKYHRLALDHRITLPNAWVPGFDGQSRDAFDQAHGPLLDGTAPTRLAGARMTTAQYTGADRGERLREFARHFRARGWFDRLYDYTADEPPYGAKWSDIPARASQVRQADPAIPTMVTTNISSAQKNGVAADIDIMAPVVNHMEGVEGAHQGDQRPKYDAFLASAPGKKLWLYQSCMSHGCSFGGAEAGTAWPSYMVDVSAARNRLMQWADFKADVSAELYYETALVFSKDPWNSQFDFSGNGDGTLFYPGTPARVGGSSHIPVASIRLKMIREGIEDFEYLAMLKRLGDPGLARAVADEVLPSLHSAGNDDPAVFERARLRLAQRIVELQGGGPSAEPGDEPIEEPMNEPIDVVGESDVLSVTAMEAGGGGCAAGGGGPAGLVPVALALGGLLQRRHSRSKRE